MRLKKKLPIIIALFVMLFSFGITSVLAEGQKTVEVDSASDLEQAIQQSYSDLVLTLNDDVETSKEIAVGSNHKLKLDLNGHHLILNDAIVRVGENADLVILDSKAPAENIEIVENASSLSGNFANKSISNGTAKIGRAHVLTPVTL